MFGSLKRSKFEKGVGGMMIWRWRAKENKNKSGYWKSKSRIKESNEGDRPFFLGFFLLEGVSACGYLGDIPNTTG